MSALRQWELPEEDAIAAEMRGGLAVIESGETQDGAFRSAKELLGCVLFGMEEDVKKIPAPSSLESLHMDANERSALIDVYMPAIRRSKAAL